MALTPDTRPSHLAIDGAARWRRRLGSQLALVLGLALAGAAAWGKQLYEYVDADGIRHFTDVAPATDQPVRSTPVQVQPRPLVRLQTQDLGKEGSRVLVHNLSAGPIEAELSLAEADNVTTEPRLPARVVIEGGASSEVTRVRSTDPGRGAAYQVQVEAVPGDPRTRPAVDHAYRVPFPSGTRYAIGQAFGGRFSHNDPQNYHAVDFGVEEGTPVLAARDGVVVQVERDFFESGGDRARLAARANYVRVMHEDGSMAVYAHLAFETVLVRPGDVVLAGQRIGAAGATGFATGPHLHFAVQRNTGMELRSIPFRLQGADGAATTPSTSRRWQRAP